MPVTHGVAGSSPVRTAKALTKRAFLVMCYFVYILQSHVDGSFYVGYSNDVDRRLAEHNAGLFVIHFPKNAVGDFSHRKI